MPSWSAAAERSEAVRGRLSCVLDVPYGDTPKQTLDIFPADRPGAPVFFYIHGGYWYQLDKAIYSEVAAPMTAAGATAVLPNYELCPDVTIPDIVDQVRRALVWVHAHIMEYNGSSDRLYVGGHSAGGHLTGMMMATDWNGLFGLPADLIKGTAPISGLFDIEPHRHTNLQPYIRLTAQTAAANSPQRLPLYFSGTMICAVGGGETRSFRRQSRDFTEKCLSLGIECDYVEVESDHHFAVTDRLGDGGDPLTQAIVARMGL